MHGVLGRLVRRVGRRAPYEAGGRLRRRFGRRPGGGMQRQSLYVPRRHGFRVYERLQLRGPPFPGRHVLRLRRPADRGRRNHPQIPRVPKGNRKIRRASSHGLFPENRTALLRRAESDRARFPVLRTRRNFVAGGKPAPAFDGKAGAELRVYPLPLHSVPQRKNHRNPADRRKRPRPGVPRRKAPADTVRPGAAKGMCRPARRGRRPNRHSGGEHGPRELRPGAGAPAEGNRRRSAAQRPQPHGVEDVPPADGHRGGVEARFFKRVSKRGPGVLPGPV